jgi:hypothetical protein
MPFVKGESGNPNGRPRGARNTATLLREALFDAEGDDLARQMVAKARDGDRGALRLCIDRVLPRGADRPILFALPRIESGADARRAIGTVTAAIETGALTPREAIDLLRVVEQSARTIVAAAAADRAEERARPAAWMADVVKALEQHFAPERESEAPAAADGAVVTTGMGTGEKAPAPGPAIAVAAPVQNNNGRGNNKNTMDQCAPLPPGGPAPAPLAAALASLRLAERQGGGALLATPPDPRPRSRASLLASTAAGATAAAASAG